MSFDTSVVLAADVRNDKGKNASRRLRAAGRVPVTLYGHGNPVTGSVSRHELGAMLRAHGRNQIFTLTLDGESSPVKIAELQTDPVRGTAVHLDLMRISLTEKTEFEVPVHVTGEPEGVKLQGGVLDVTAHSLRIRCLPADLPEAVEVNVAALKIGGHIRARDLNLGEQVELVSDPDTMIATVLGHKPEETATATEGAAEPEVMQKGKKEEK